MEKLSILVKNNENIWGPAIRPSQDSEGRQQQTVELRISEGEGISYYISLQISLFNLLWFYNVSNICI